MLLPEWQIKTPIDAVIFDCDGTLSEIEGIDELAAKYNVGDKVRELTQEAMGRTGINPDIYRERMKLVKPRQEDLLALARQYFANRVPEAAEVIQILKRLNKAVYIVSAGLDPAVTLFGGLLDVPAENIFAVGVTFDACGAFKDYDHASPLTHRLGKREIVSEIKHRHPHLAYVGDGMNDLVAFDMATRFVGYGGSYYRENIASQCQFYINTQSMASLLALILTQEELALLGEMERPIYLKGLKDIEVNRVIMR